MDLSKTLVKIFGPLEFFVKKHSPEMLVGVGIIGVIGSTVLCCKASMKAEIVLINHRDKMGLIERAEKYQTEDNPYSDKDKKKDLTVAYTQTAVDFIKLYGPSVTLGLLSIACIIGGHGLLKKRNVAIMAAYKALEEGFASYRQRVIEEHGAQKDYMYCHNLREETVTTTEVGEDGKEHKVKQTVLIPRGPASPSIYAKYFEEGGSTEWSRQHGYNLAFLRTQQTFFNDLLRIKGHVFLNDVYRALGFDDTEFGAVVGWRVPREKHSDQEYTGDTYVDFDLENPYNHTFLNGDNSAAVRLDFNVDGIIYDKI